MKRLILSITIFFCILLCSCNSPSTSSSTDAPQLTTMTSPPPITQPSLTISPTLTATPIVPTETPTFTATSTDIPVFWDDFSGELLPGWSWIRENDALWSLETEPGYLRIVLTGDRPPRNLLVRDVILENFQIMTKVLFKPTSNWQFAGLLVYQDEKTNLALGRAFCNTPVACVGNGIYFDAVQNGQTIGTNFSIDTVIKDEAYLRLDKNGMKYTGYYSENGSDWMMLGEHEVSITDPKVGLITANSFVVGRTALFDYFSAVEMP